MEEKICTQYMEEKTREILAEALNETLILRNLNEVIHKKETGIADMLKNKKLDDLSNKGIIEI